MLWFKKKWKVKNLMILKIYRYDGKDKYIFQQIKLTTRRKLKNKVFNDLSYDRIETIDGITYCTYQNYSDCALSATSLLSLYDSTSKINGDEKLRLEQVIELERNLNTQYFGLMKKNNNSSSDSSSLDIKNLF